MASQFISNSNVTYDIASDGTTTVSHDITLENVTSDFYATSYTLSLSGITPINPVASESGQNLPVKITQSNGTTNLEVDFPDAVVGQGQKREFVISFQDKTLVNKNGEIWEITTPRLGDATSFDGYSTTLKVPDVFGNLAYISPNPTNKSADKNQNVYNFDKNASLKTTITAAFGNFQVFSFNLTYHLENPLNQTATTTIALPPDTNYQKINLVSIDPRPLKIDIDTDGNWIATYELKPQQKVDVKATGAVQLFANAQTNPKPDYTKVTSDLGATDLWQVNDLKIQTLAKQLKTPQAIYNYVTTHLSYDYARVAPNVQRLGAVGALNNPTQAICTEFTDLFVALARAAGIPAREIEGYAYTENPQIQPLSLVADVLHAWPEYWDDKTQAWIPVDPTWGSTSGIDYFNKLDLRHFAFVIHGEDDKKPYPAGSYKLGTNPQKDVDVQFGSLPANRISKLSITRTVTSQLPFSDEIVDVKLANSGPVAIYDADFGVSFDNKLQPKQNIISIIPPYGYYETNVDIPYSFLGQKTPEKIDLSVNGNNLSEFTSYKVFVTLSNLLLMCLVVFALVFMIYLAFRDAKAKKHSGESGSLPVQK
ncbi:MAG TPA: transglutaminase-like domain-containing protein [Patescibacteria group bacterium]|nr:transglutaminase-like domain-containing protein [Patescibacteria group bacterium]